MRSWSLDLPPQLEAEHENRIANAQTVEERTRARAARRADARRRSQLSWERAHRRTVGCKVTLSEYQKICTQAYQRGVSVSGLLRDMLQQCGYLDAPEYPENSFIFPHDAVFFG